MAARSVPECGAAGAQGWNIDYLAPSWCPWQVQAERAPQWNVQGWWVGCLTRCWVLRDRATPPAAGFSSGVVCRVLLVVGPAESSA